MGLPVQGRVLECKTSVAAGAPFELGAFGLQGAVLSVSGTFSATLQVQGSLDGGLTYVDWVTFTGTAVGNITTAARFLLGGDATHIRMNTSVFTSGTPVAQLFLPSVPARADRRLAP